MIEVVRKYIESHQLIKPHDYLLVAVSGGVDSIVMAYLLHQFGYRIAMAHCNYQLRGEDSEKDMELVKKFGKQLNVTTHVKRFEIKPEESTQLAARELRYSWFEELVAKEGYSLVATAHHRNDQAETVILNIAKGTGLKGLTGIPFKRGRIIRPLLQFSKAEIENYAKEHKLNWREDRSNQDSKYQRNKIRNQVIPVLQSINPQVDVAIARMSDYMGSIHQYYVTQMQRLEVEIVVKESGQLKLEVSQLNESELPVFIPYWMMKYGFNQEQVSQAMSEIHGAGRLFHSSTHQLTVDRGFLWMNEENWENEDTAIEKGDGTVELKLCTLWTTVKQAADYKVSADQKLAAMDLSKLQFPLKVRNWREGDYFIPLGMKGKKKVSDFMIDEKIPVNLKRHQLVITSGSDIVWLVGQRISDLVKIAEKTEEVFEIKMVPHA